MDVMGYTIIEEETLPSFLKGKPQVVVCLTLAAALLVVTALSITIGIFIGYTYCYLEHRSGIIKANVTRTIKIIPLGEYADNRTKTINDAIINNVLVTKLLKLSGIRAAAEPVFTNVHDCQNDRNGHKVHNCHSVHNGLSVRNCQNAPVNP